MGTVYRWEDYRGRGPYSGFECLFDHSDDEHPSPQAEFLPMKSGVHLCGFESMAQMNRWFTKDEQKIMRKEGFRLVKRQSDQVVKGDRQLIFIPSP